MRNGLHFGRGFTAVDLALSILLGVIVATTVLPYARKQRKWELPQRADPLSDKPPQAGRRTEAPPTFTDLTNTVGHETNP